MPAELPIRIALVDDHPVVRAGIRLFLEATGEIAVVGEASCGDPVYEQVPQWQADLIIWDMPMPGTGGIEAMRRILKRQRKAKILIFSGYEDLTHVRRAICAGAAGYLSKKATHEELIDAIRKVANGKLALDSLLGPQLSAAAQPAREAASSLTRLTEQEFKSFMGLARGLSTRQLAQHTSVTVSTAGTHFYNIKRKLEVENQSEITLLAVRHGLIEP